MRKVCWCPQGTSMSLTYVDPRGVHPCLIQAIYISCPKWIAMGQNSTCSGERYNVGIAEFNSVYHSIGVKFRLINFWEHEWIAWIK